MDKKMSVKVQEQPKEGVTGSDPRKEVIHAAALPGAIPCSEKPDTENSTDNKEESETKLPDNKPNLTVVTP